MAIANPVIQESFGNSSTARLNLPTHDPGDLLIAWLHFDHTTKPLLPLPWEEIDEVTHGSTFGLVAYQKIASDSEPGFYDFIMFQSTRWSGGIAAYKGADLSSGNKGKFTRVYSRPKINPSQIATIQDNSRAISIIAQRAVVNWSAPSSWNLRSQINTGSNYKVDSNVALFDTDVALIGNTPDETFTNSLGLNKVMVIAANTSIANNADGPIMKEIFQDLGLTTTVLNDTQSQSGYANTAANHQVCVVINQLNTLDLRANATNLDIGVVVCADGSFGYFEFGTGSSNLTTKTSLTCSIDPNYHPVAEGFNLNDTYTVYTQTRGMRVVSNPTASYEPVFENSSSPVIGTYEKGTFGDGGFQFPARRMLSGFRNTNFTEDGKNIIKNGIDWVGRYGNSPMIGLTFSIPEKIIVVGEVENITINGILSNALESSSAIAQQSHSLSISAILVEDFEITTPEFEQLADLTINPILNNGLDRSGGELSQIRSIPIESIVSERLIKTGAEVSQHHTFTLTNILSPRLDVEGAELSQLVSIILGNILTINNASIVALSQQFTIQLFDILGGALNATKPTISQRDEIELNDILGEQLEASEPVISQNIDIDLENIIGNGLEIEGADPSQFFNISINTIINNALTTNDVRISQVNSLTLNNIVGDPLIADLPTVEQHHNVNLNNVLCDCPIESDGGILTQNINVTLNPILANALGTSRVEIISESILLISSITSDSFNITTPQLSQEFTLTLNPILGELPNVNLALIEQIFTINISSILNAQPDLIIAIPSQLFDVTLHDVVSNSLEISTATSSQSVNINIPSIVSNPIDASVEIFEQIHAIAINNITGQGIEVLGGKIEVSSIIRLNPIVALQPDPIIALISQEHSVSLNPVLSNSEIKDDGFGQLFEINTLDIFANEPIIFPFPAEFGQLFNISLNNILFTISINEPIFTILESVMLGFILSDRAQASGGLAGQLHIFPIQNIEGGELQNIANTNLMQNHVIAINRILSEGVSTTGISNRVYTPPDGYIQIIAPDVVFENLSVSEIEVN